MSNKEIASEGFVIMNPLTGRPMKKTPSGIPLKDVTFKTKEELNKFVTQHWENPVFMTDGKNLESP